MATISDVLRLENRLGAMDSSFNAPSNQPLDAVITLWWRERIQLLIDEGRPADAKGLYLEFGEYQSKRLNPGQT